MRETAEGLRDSLNAHRNHLITAARKTNNSAAVPVAYSKASIDNFRTRVKVTIERYLEALGTCGIVVDSVVEREMLQEIRKLTATQPSLSFPPMVRAPNATAVQQEHARESMRVGSALQREAANRLREIKMKASRSALAAVPTPMMPQSTPFTIGSVAKTLAELKAFRPADQAMFLLRRLVYLYPQVKRSGGFNKHNILLPGDSCGLAQGFSDAEKMRVLEHLLGAPWTRLVNDGYLVDPRGSGFFSVSEEGTAAAEEAATPKPAAMADTSTLRLDGVPRVFISYSWDGNAHRDWVIHLATRLRQDGINVVLDYWDLLPGGDRTTFMERSILNSEFVLIVCTPGYAVKANERSGGAGYEAMVITTQIAKRIDQTKFIPVLRLGNFDDSAVPIWLQTKIGIDLRGDHYSEQNYEDLVRTLHRENIKAPPVGPRPVFSDKKHLSGKELVDNAVSAMLAPSTAEVESRNESRPAQPPPVAYVFYQTKGPEAHQVHVYVRPLDARGERFRMEPSNGESVEGTLAEIAQRYLLLDDDLRRKGYSRMTTYNGSGGQNFNLP